MGSTFVRMDVKTAALHEPISSIAANSQRLIPLDRGPKLSRVKFEQASVA
jgi:hypothetical protein